MALQHPEAGLGPALDTLYRSLLASGPILCEDPRYYSQAADDLVALGLARRIASSEGDRLISTPVPQAFGQATDALITEFHDRHETLNRLRDVHQRWAAHPDVGRDEVVTLVSATDIADVSERLVLSARRSFLTMDPATFRQRRVTPRDMIALPPPRLRLRLRTLCEPELLDHDNRTALFERMQLGLEVRSLPHLPTKLQLIDETMALLPCDESAATGGFIVRSAPVVRALHLLFDLLWAQATPVVAESGEPDDVLSPIQARVLTLVGRGHTDAAIATQLHISDRSVRRHIADSEMVLGVQGRTAAVYRALREGLIV